MSALDAANAHPLAAAKLAEWGVEVEEDLLFLEAEDVDELCAALPKIPARKCRSYFDQLLRTAAASVTPGAARKKPSDIAAAPRDDLPRQVLSALAPPSTCLRGHPHRPQPPSPQLRRAAGRAKPLPPSPRPRRLLPRLRRNACHPRLPRPPRCSLRRSRSPFAFTRNLTDLSLACEALLPTHWRTCVVTGASGKQVTSTAVSLPGQGSVLNNTCSCRHCGKQFGCAGGRCCRGRGERVRGGVASGASEPPAALCAACTLARAKKICHPQEGFFLSFSGLFGRVFFLRVNFLKGGVALYRFSHKWSIEFTASPFGPTNRYCGSA